MLDTVAVENYRSLRRLVVPLRGCNVVTGPNGSGKSSLYRALRLLADSARNGSVNALAREGGLSSTMWAGQGKKGPVSLKLGFAGEDFGYAVDFGMPVPGKSEFNLDPEIKSEAVWAGPVLRPSALLAQRSGPAVLLRDAEGEWRTAATLRPFDSMLSEVADPQAAPELLALRERVRSWRFYDHVRTDSAAPARQPQIGTRTMVLSHDGADLAAALQTIAEIGDAARTGRGGRRRVCGQPGGDPQQRRPLRGHPAPARDAAGADRGRTVRRHAALSAVGGRVAHPAAGRADGAQRAGGQPAPRPAARTGRADRPVLGAIPGRRRHPRRRIGRRRCAASSGT